MLAKIMHFWFGSLLIVGPSLLVVAVLLDRWTAVVAAFVAISAPVLLTLARRASNPLFSGKVN